MRTWFMLLLLGAAGAGLLTATCCKKSPTGPDNNDPGPVTYTYSYTSNSTTIVVTVPEHTDTSRYCIIDSFVVDYETVPLAFLVWTYALNGNALALVHGNDTANYTRSVSGSGLAGLWTIDALKGVFPSRITFAESTVSLVYEKCWADEFITYDWAPDSANYDVALLKASCSRVVLTGGISGETVTITWNSRGDKTTSSSIAAHSPHIWYVQPLLCPNPEYPGWYYSDFLDDNFRE